MSIAELVVLGTASQAPTRHRNHNGYALRWGGHMIFFDPGEGFQRQCTIAGVAIARGDAVCLTHFHGDHCLGLPGLIARRGLDRCPEPLQVFYPAAGEQYFERLRTCTAGIMQPLLEPRPVTAGSSLRRVGSVGDLSVEVAALQHRVSTQGYRISSPAGRRFIPEELEAAGLAGPIVGELMNQGTVDGPDGPVDLAQVSEEVPGRSFAFVMDTKSCPGAELLARGVDMLVCESTFLESERSLADSYAHMTAADAGRLAAAAGAKRLVLTHFSARYSNMAAFAEEASEFHGDVVVAEDLDRIPFPA
ncbi:MAG: ribonuclease Z [Acidimicrobiales bacterium]|nr:ribonuclease Z [Acidimicrobiales bacterium]